MIDFYKTTAGAGWKEKDNWGSLKPLEEWFGLEVEDSSVVGMCDPFFFFVVVFLIADFFFFFFFFFFFK